MIDAELRTRSGGYFGQCARPQPAVRVEPPDPWVTPEPGFLAAGEAPGGAHGLVAGLIPGQLAVEITEHLLVAERAARGLAVPQAAGGQLPDLRLAAGRPHAVDPGLDPAVEFRAVYLEAELDRGAATVVAGHRRAERAPGQLDDLKRADDPAAVAGQDHGGRGRVGGPEALIQRGRAVGRQLGFLPLP